MKIVLISLVILFVFPGVFGQCGDELKPGETGELLKTIEVSLAEPDEFGLSIKARVPRGSWAKGGSEAAVLTVFVDGIYRVDMPLFAGAESFEYTALLGRLGVGNHHVSIFANSARSSPNAGRAIISNARVRRLLDSKGGRSNYVDKLATENSPVVYIRENVIDKFSDIPLVSYYEILPEKEGALGIRYTMIFTNEDGGTQTTALMARWGRTTDIEWVYEVWFRDGKRVSEKYQGANHVTTEFKGRRLFGDHPALKTITVNNNFSDTGCTRLRVSLVPVRADLTYKSRETVMDENPWTYRIMAEEAFREGRINPAMLDANTIDDFRNYLFVEVFTENNGTAVSVEAITNAGKTSTSDLNNVRLRVGRPGYQRIAVRLAAKSHIRSLKLNCHRTADGNDKSACGKSKLIAFIRLNDDFSPKAVRARKETLPVIRSGEFIEWRLASN